MKRNVKNLLKAWIIGSGLFSLSVFAFFSIPIHFTAFEKIKINYSPSELLILDRDLEILHELRTNKKVRRLNWVSLSEVRPDTLSLLLRAEDQRYYVHRGIDFYALINSAWQRLLGKGYRGASTITMQVADLLLMDAPKKQRRNWIQKLNQMRRAVHLEAQWSKEQILEAYLNLVSFRGELQGLRTAAAGLFGKSLSALKPSESAILAVLIRSPQASEKQVVARSCRLLRDISEECAPVEWREKYKIAPMELEATHALKFLPKSSKTGTIQVSLDKTIQSQVRAILNREVARLSDKNMNAAAAVVLDNQTGEVLAYVGNIGRAGQGSEVDGAYALRQAGSTLKPFIYALAIEQKKLTASSILLDTPTDLAVATGLYRPSNFDHRFRNAVSARTALASSLNIPAVKVLESVGVDQFVEFLEANGATGLERPDFYGPSMALGSADVKLLELTNAYRTLANGGRFSAYTFEKNLTTESRQLLTPQTSFIISDILSDRGSRAETFGFDSPLAQEFWTAVKTGTSKDMRDNWCIGYSDHFTVGVWAGNLDGEPMWGVSGVQGAAPAWAAIIRALHEHRPSQRPAPPDGLITKDVRFGSSDRFLTEWYLAGTEPPGDRVPLTPAVSSKIIYPVNETLVAVDPDIPKKNQKIMFQVEDPEPGQWLRLNGKKLARAESNFSWTPIPGNFLLELISPYGQPLDQTRFKVKKR